MKLDIRRAKTPADLLAFAHGAEAHDFEPAFRPEAYGHIRDTLRRFPYERLSRPDRGIIRAYLGKSASFSRAQLTRLVAQYCDTGQLRDWHRAAAPFARKYTDADIRLLADTNELHEGLSAPARAQRPAWASAGRHRASGRPPRPLWHLAGSGPVFPQLRRPGHAVGTGAVRAASAHDVVRPALEAALKRCQRA